MLKTLRITSFVCIAAAAIGVIFVLLFGLRKNSDIEALLAKPSVVDNLRKTNQSAAQVADSVSPLISEAKAFALRINPPPPPPPPPPVAPVESGPVETAQDVVSPNRTFSSKFNLLGTVHYTTSPQKSLALLDLVSEGQKWFRQGETVGRLTIHEIKEGSVILYSNGKFDSELFVPAPTPVRSLLKSDNNWSSTSPRPSSAPTENVKSVGRGRPVKAQPVSQPTMTVAPPQSPSDNIPTNTPDVSPALAIRQARAPEPEPTPQERKASIEESISGIKQIMNETRESLSDAERQEENKAWVDLLKVLEEEKKAIENAPEGTPPGENRPQE